MKTRVFAVCSFVFLLLVLTNAAQADSAKLVNPADGHSYQRFDTGMNWTSAQTACAGLGGHLATITSQAENDWIIKNILYIEPDTYLGARYNSSTWQWITGESFGYTYWGQGEPNLDLKTDMYITMAIRPGLYTNPMGLGWNNVNGTDSYPHLCEWDNSVCTDIAVKPHTFTTGTPAKAAEVNADFDTLYQQINTQNCQIQALKAIVCQDHPTASVCQ